MVAGTQGALAVFKISYNPPFVKAEGGVCGTAFFIDEKTVLTAGHVLNEKTLQPNQGYNRVDVYLISRSQKMYRVKEEWVSTYHKVDASVIRFPRARAGAFVLPISQTPPVEGEGVYNVGYEESGMPDFLDSKYEGKKLDLRRPSLAKLGRKASGEIKKIWEDRDIKARDMHIVGAQVLELSYGGVVGMSGGALIRSETGEVLGMMSFGLPMDVKVKTNLCAVGIDSILEVLGG